MKLYYKPGACSLASHVVLHEAGIAFDIEEVDTQAGRTKSGADYTAINPKGYVPALELASGEVLTEGASILQYIADQHPESDLAPKAGTIARARLQEHLNYTASELHKAFGPFFSGTADEADKQAAGKAVARKFDYLNDILSDGRTYLLGDSFSVADAYLFVVANWSNFTGIDLKKWPAVAAFVERVAARPAAQTAMKAEGLL
ncbi:glutathione transferase GstA [Anderseniella sp. Alg231-50]|uniref:glutathione transferase GstA n=1 Tax=Anderseniella sp. Alg231-50 TaxID=1922226 RepID=UPI000D54B6F8